MNEKFDGEDIIYPFVGAKNLNIYFQKVIAQKRKIIKNYIVQKKDNIIHTSTIEEISIRKFHSRKRLRGVLLFCLLFLTISSEEDQPNLNGW